MAFGGLFGGSGSKEPSKDSSSESITASPSTAFSSFSPSSSSSSSSQAPSDIRQRIQAAITLQSNVENAKFLIQKVNENCFEHCVPTPGSSLSSKESTCLSACMEKYIEAWNLTSRSYNTRLHKDSMAVGGSALSGGSGSGKELF